MSSVIFIEKDFVSFRKARILLPHLVAAELSLVEKHSKLTVEKLQTAPFEASLMSLRFENSSSVENSCGTNESWTLQSILYIWLVIQCFLLKVGVQKLGQASWLKHQVTYLVLRQSVIYVIDWGLCGAVRANCYSISDFAKAGAGAKRFYALRGKLDRIKSVYGGK